MNCVSFKKVDKFIPESSLSTDNAWLEYTIVKLHDDESDKLFEEIPLKTNGNFVWKELTHLLDKMTTDKDVEKSLRKLL